MPIGLPKPGEPVIYFPAFADQDPVRAKFVGPNDDRHGSVTVELLGGARDGARVKALVRDPSGRMANSWCRTSEFSPPGV